MSNLISYTCQDKEVRRVDINGDPWFVICDVLNAMNSSTEPSKAGKTITEELGEGLVINHPLQTAGGVQTVLITNEAGLTFLVSRSRTEQGKLVNRWIHTEVLPSIRKTGSYSIQPKSSADMFLLIAQQFKEQESRLEIVEMQNIELEQKLISASETVETLKTQLELEATKLTLSALKVRRFLVHRVHLL